MDGLEFQTKVRINKFRLGFLQGFLGNDSNIISKGNINGKINLAIEKGFIKCKGDLIARIRLRGGF